MSVAVCIRSIVLVVSAFAFVVPISIFKETDDKILLPRFWGLYNIGEPNKYVFGECDKINLKCVFEPKKYQKPVIKKILVILKKDYGTTLSVHCGWGKTFAALYLSTKLNCKTLIIVHTKVLLKQWIERIEQFIPGARIGMIQGKNYEVEDKDFVIAMLQSIVSKSRKYTFKNFKSFGFTIFDECHHIAAPGFSKSMPVILSKYVLGLSATPKREDGLEDVFYSSIGQIGFLAKSSNKMAIDVNIINYSSNLYREIRMWNRSLNLHKMLELIIENKKRNFFIVKLINKIMQTEGRQILVLSGRVNHLKVLKRITDIFLKENNKKPITSSLYIGGLKSSELEEASKCNILFATYQLVSEGTDIPTLNALIMASPKKKIEQVSGRITRGKSTLKPVIYDICDNFSIYHSQSRHRHKFYDEQKYSKITYNMSDNTSHYNLEDLIQKNRVEPKKIELEEIEECLI